MTRVPDVQTIGRVADRWSALPERLAGVRGEIARAATRVGRSPDAIQIIAVTKTHPPSAVEAAVGAGLAHVGENYVQEGAAKRAATEVPAVWHLIGGLQRNKIKAAVATFDWIHTVDSVLLAEAVCRQASRSVQVLVQVLAEDRGDRRGVPPEGARAVAEAILGAGGPVGLAGVMVLPPAEAAGEVVRGAFRMAREVRDDLQRGLGVELPHLSMGMSDDFAVAVEEGATLLRLGRVLLGSREAGAWREGS